MKQLKLFGILLTLVTLMGATAINTAFVALAPVHVVQANGVVVPYGFGASTDVARGTALYNAVVAAAANAGVETIEIGAGTFDLGTNKLALGDGDGLKGQGIGATTLKGTRQWSTGGAIINPGANNYVGQFSIDTTGFDESGGQTCVAIGALNQTGTYTSDHKFTGLVVEGVKFVTDIDSFVVVHADSSTASYGATFRDCGFVGAWDHFAVTASNGTPTGNFDFHNCDFTTTGTLITTPVADARVAVMAGLSAGGLKGRFYGGSFTTSGGTTSNTSVNTTGAGVIELYNPRISTTGTSATDLVRSSISTLKVVGGTGSGTGGAYTTSGTITRSSDLLCGTVPTTAGLTLIDDADASAQRTTLGLAIGSNVQAYDADLTTYAAITPSANVQSLLGAANYSAMRTLLTLVPGTDVQAYDADLTTYAGITPSANVQSMLAAANYAAINTLLGTLTTGANTFTRLQTITQGTANEGVLASSGYSLTGSDATSMVSLAGTLNTSGSPSVIKLNITNTASGSATKLLDLQTGGISRTYISPAGISLGISNTTSERGWIFTTGTSGIVSFGRSDVTGNAYAGAGIYNGSNAGLFLGSSGWLQFSSGSFANGGGYDLFVKRRAAAWMDISGASSAPAGLGVAYIDGGNSKTLTESSATNLVQISVASGNYVSGILHYSIRANDGTDYQIRSGSVHFTAVNKAGTVTVNVGTAINESVSVSAGTLTVTIDATTGTNAFLLRANAVSSLTQTTLAGDYRPEIFGTATTITPQ